MASFNAITFNCNGLGDKKKRQKVFSYVKEKVKSGLFFLQETHSTPQLESKWKNEWNGKLFFSHGSRNSTGCAIGFSKKFNFKLIKESKDTEGRILILEVEIDDQKFLLINLYNANSETDQINVLDTLSSKLEEHDPDGECKPIFGGDFNLIFDTILDSSGGNPTLKKRSIFKIMKIIEKLDACDIFRVRYPNLKRFTFHRKNPVIQRRLDYLFISNNIQEHVEKVDILPSFMSDHSPVFITINLNSNLERGNYGWKFNNSLLNDEIFVSKMIDHIENIKNNFTDEQNPHVKWEFLKYELRKFSISFAKNKNKELLAQKEKHERIITNYESTENRPPEVQYAESKAFLEDYIDKKTAGSILRSKCEFYEQNEKSTKFFLNLEIKNSEKNTVKKLLTENNAEVNDCKNILLELHKFYSALFSKNVHNSEQECLSFLDTINIPSISEEHKNFCDKELTLDDLSASLAKMNSGKSPGNDGLTVCFYKIFWLHIKNTLFDSYNYSKTVGTLSSSQRQAIIKLIEKRDKDKRYIQNWRPISLLNVDTKLISKCIASRLIPVLPTIISPDQTAYVKGRYIGESIRLISDILDTTDMFDIPGYILTADLEKAFDSIDHTFLLACLKKFGFGENFILWTSILLTDNESCVSNGGHTTSYFKLARGARQGDPIAAYFFIIVLEIFFIMLRENNGINKIKILGFEYLLSAYADDTTFFVADLASVNIILVTFNTFSRFSGLKMNKSKCEITGIGVKKNDVMALCGFKNVSLVNGAIRILGVYFSYNQLLYTEKNFIDSLKKLQDVTKIWSMRSLSLYGKITIFKSLALSKVVYISSMANIPSEILKLIEDTHKSFIWSNKRPKIKHSTLIANYSMGGLKDVDVASKFKSLRLNWLKRLYDDNFHPWKHIPLHFFKEVSANSLLFLPNLNISLKNLEKIPVFYQDVIKYWIDISQSEPLTPSMILSESLLFNSFIKIGNKPIPPVFLNSNNSIFLSDIFDNNGNFVTLAQFREKFTINCSEFNWIQIKHSIPPDWINTLKNTQTNLDICDFSIHLNNKARIISIKKLDSRVFNSLFIDKIYRPPTSQRFFEHKFGRIQSWDKIYLLPRTVTKDSYMQIFQYKIVHNILFLNARLFRMQIVDTPACSLCHNVDETTSHIFSECPVTQNLWNQIKNIFAPHLIFDDLIPQSALLGFLNVDDDHIIKNHILLIFKFCIYKYREKTLNVHIILQKIKSIYKKEKFINLENPARFERKWNKVIPLL